MQVPLFTSLNSFAKNTSKVVLLCGIWGLNSGHTDKTYYRAAHGCFSLVTLTGSAREVLKQKLQSNH